MASDRSGPFYDLEEAASLTRELAGRERTPADDAPRPGGDEPPRTSGYVRFSAERIRYGKRVERGRGDETVDVTGEVPWSSEMMGSAGWRHLVDWCLEATDADAVFVVDARGLVVAGSGALPAEEVEAAGARLLALFEHADQLLESQGEARSINVELELGWLTGLRAAVRRDDPEDGTLIVGIVTTRPLSDAARRNITEAFAKKALGI